MAKKTATPEGMIEIQGTVKATFKTLVPTEATMEQKIDALLAAFLTDVKGLSEVHVKYTSKAGLDALREAHNNGIGLPAYKDVPLVTACTPPAHEDSSESINDEAVADGYEADNDDDEEEEEEEEEEENTSSRSIEMSAHDKKILNDDKIVAYNPDQDEAIHDEIHETLKVAATKSKPSKSKSSKKSAVAEAH